MTPGSLHEGYVALVGAETRGFKRAIRAIMDESEVIDWWRGIPDGYRIDVAAQEVVVYEVEIGGPLTPRRIQDYAALWFYLDCEEWDLRLITVDRFGVQTERPLVSAYYAGLYA